MLILFLFLHSFETCSVNYFTIWVVFRFPRTFNNQFNYYYIITTKFKVYVLIPLNSANFGNSFWQKTSRKLDFIPTATTALLFVAVRGPTRVWTPFSMKILDKFKKIPAGKQNQRQKTKYLTRLTLSWGLT